MVKKIILDKNINNINKTRHLLNKQALWRGMFTDMDTIDTVLAKGVDIVNKSKKNSSRIATSAIRMLMQERVEEITNDKFAFVDIDKKFLQTIKNDNIELQGDWPRKKRIATKDIRDDEDENVADDTNDRDDTTRETTTVPSNDDSLTKTDMDTEIPVADESNGETVQETESENDNVEMLNNTKSDIEESSTNSGDGEEEEEKSREISLPDINPTHPDDIPEQSTPVVKDQIQAIDVEVDDTLPNGVIPTGQDSIEQETQLIDPETLGDDSVENGQTQDRVEDLPSYSDIESDDDSDNDSEKLIITSEGFDNKDIPVRINHIPSSVEIQSMIIDVLVQETRPYMDSDREAKEFVLDMLGTDMDIESVDNVEQKPEPTLDDNATVVSDNSSNGPRQNNIEETDLQSKVSTDDVDGIDTTPIQVDDDVEKNESTGINNSDDGNTNKQSIDDSVIMSEPSKMQLRLQKKNAKDIKTAEKQIAKEHARQIKHQNVVNALHADIFNSSSPIITDDDESKMMNNRSRDVVVRDYIAKIALKHIDNIQREKAAIVGQIRSGHVKSAWILHTSDNETANKSVSDSIVAQDIQDRLRNAINSKYLARSSDILAEVADYTSRNVERIQQGLDPSNAISKYIYPSFRDPDTFNIVKYRSDADGNVVINSSTGQPIIESISATSRDDGKKLLDQKQAVDATDTPSPYYPIYGKQARRFFSKHEFNYLGRLFQGAGGKPRGSIPKPMDIKGEINLMLREMSSSLEIKDTSIHGENSFRQWSELSILKSSFHRYNQNADYQYIQDKKELQQDGTMVDPDAVESAAKLLQNITVQKLLDLMSSQRARQEQVLDSNNPKTNAGDLTDKQQTAELGEFDMDITKDPKNVGAEIPPDSDTEPPIEGASNNDTPPIKDDSNINLNNWVSTQPSFQPPKKQMYRFADNLAPFGGDMDKLIDL